MNARKAPGLALILAFSLLMAGVPIVITPVAADSCPALTLDICHPAQAIGAASLQASLPLPPIGMPRQALPYQGTTNASIEPAAARAAGPPATPPPKS